MTPSKTTESILRRLRALGVDIPGPDGLWLIKRTHAGCRQRSCGAWCWCLDLIDSNRQPIELRRFEGIYGGYWPATLCAKPGSTLNEDRFGRITLDPSDEVIRKS